MHIEIIEINEIISASKRFWSGFIHKNTWHVYSLQDLAVQYIILRMKNKY